jgi:hypothetical protein
MPVKKVNAATLGLSIIGIFVCGSLTLMFYRQGRNPTETLAAVGSVASVFGLVIAIVEILAVKKVTDATHIAVKETKDQLVSRISLADVAKATRIVEQIQTQLVNKKFELAHVRLQDLREMLMQFRAGRLLKDGQNEQYDELLKNMGIHSENLYTAIYKNRSIDITVINHTLQSMVEILVTAENELTFGGE